TERVARVGRVGEQSAAADDLDRLVDQAGLRVVRVHVEVAGHATEGMAWPAIERSTHGVGVSVVGGSVGALQAAGAFQLPLSEKPSIVTVTLPSTVTGKVPIEKLF